MSTKQTPKWSYNETNIVIKYKLNTFCVTFSYRRPLTVLQQNCFVIFCPWLFARSIKVSRITNSGLKLMQEILKVFIMNLIQIVSWTKHELSKSKTRTFYRLKIRNKHENHFSKIQYNTIVNLRTFFGAMPELSNNSFLTLEILTFNF